MENTIRTLPPPSTTHPSSQPQTQAHGQDNVAWAKWDNLGRRRFLVLGYERGAVQVWDVSELDAVCEVLHLSASTFSPASPHNPSAARDGNRDGGEGREKERVVPRMALILPGSASEAGGPMLGVLLSSAEVVLYSLGEHVVATRVSVFGKEGREGEVVECAMQAGEEVLGVSLVVRTFFCLIFFFREREKS